jgi:hypothetical protein
MLLPDHPSLLNAAVDPEIPRRSEALLLEAETVQEEVVQEEVTVDPLDRLNTNN